MIIKILQTIFLSFFVFLFFNMPNIKFFSYNKFGNIDYNNEKYDEAREIYNKSMIDSTKESISIFNIWNTFYKEQDYEKSIEKYEEITEKNPDKEIQAKLFHNIWNSYYRLWEKMKWQERLYNRILALKNYEKSINIKEDEETRKNYEFLLKKIKQEEKQQEEQKEKEGNQEDKWEWEWEWGEWNMRITENYTPESYKMWEESEIKWLTQEEKENLEYYKKLLREQERNNQKYFNKNEQNNSIEDFFNIPFFNNDILEKNEKDW